MITTKILENVTVTTWYNNDMVMTRASIESETRIVTISLGTVSKTWAIFLASKTEETAMGHNKNLRVYVNKDWDFTVNYWDKKLKELNR